MKLFCVFKLHERISSGILIFITIVSLLWLNCSSNGDFRVTVYSSEGQAIVGARIAGGIDWDYFCVETDFEGNALLPDHARGQWARIYKNNFYPLIIEELTPGLYLIEPTPQRFTSIGEIEGDAIRFDAAQIITITYHGDYHVYTYSDQQVTEIVLAQLPAGVRFFKVFGDTLWLSTHGEGFYVYSLQNPQQPQQICHLDISGYNIRPFAVKDTILAVGIREGPLRIFSFDYSGQYQELASIGDYWVNDMTFISHYLIVNGCVTGNIQSQPIIYDVQDPANPQLIYTGSQPDSWTGILYENFLVLHPYYWNNNGSTGYKLLDLTNPASPQELGPFPTDVTLAYVIEDNIAIGERYEQMPSVAVLNGAITSGFNTVAILSEMLGEGFGGSLPPYYIVGNQLWKLSD